MRNSTNVGVFILKTFPSECDKLMYYLYCTCKRIVCPFLLFGTYSTWLSFSSQYITKKPWKESTQGNKIILLCPYKAEGIPNVYLKVHFIFHFPNSITDGAGNLFSNEKWHSMQLDVTSAFNKLYILIKDFIKKAPEYIEIQVDLK